MFFEVLKLILVPIERRILCSSPFIESVVDLKEASLGPFLVDCPVLHGVERVSSLQKQDNRYTEQQRSEVEFRNGTKGAGK